MRLARDIVSIRPLTLLGQDSWEATGGMLGRLERGTCRATSKASAANYNQVAS